MLGAAACLLLPLLPAAVRAAEPQPNPPQWPSSVKVFGPEDGAAITAHVNWAYQQNGGHTPQDHGQFSSQRFAVLFQPGQYDVEVPVGYYTQVLGLGIKPHDTVFTSKRGVYSEEGDQSNMGGALSTFWRGAENFMHNGDMLWAVSQASPLRRLVVTGSLNLAQFVPSVGMGYSSGGFLANTWVGQSVNAGSQQQWFTRNADMQGWPQGVWNMVFVGVNGAPPSHCGRSPGKIPSVNVPQTPLVAEKPFITVDGAGKFYLQIPEALPNRVGSNFDPPARHVDFTQVFVARDTDTAATINKHLNEGLHVVLSPGIYNLEAPLELKHQGQVLLGLGLATLVAARGSAAVRVGNVGGVRIAGVLLQAGPGPTDALLEWGDGSYPGSADDPGFMHDVFARVGGPNDQNVEQVRAKVMVRLSSGHVIGDNLWLWRADHSVSGKVKGGMNPCDHGLLVYGDNVRMYGLAVEHTLKDLVQWSGEAGETYFFQSELPYDVTQEAFGDRGYVGYRVNDTVTTHKAYGIGVYHFFRDFAVTVQQGIAVPPWLVNSIESPLTVCLTANGRVNHVLNDMGGPTAKGEEQVQWSCEKGPYVVPAPRGRRSRPRLTTPRPDAWSPPIGWAPHKGAPSPPGGAEGDRGRGGFDVVPMLFGFLQTMVVLLTVAGLYYLLARRSGSFSAGTVSGVSPSRSRGASARVLSRTPNNTLEEGGGRAAPPALTPPGPTPPGTPGKEATAYQWPALSPGGMSARTIFSPAASPCGSPALLPYTARSPVTPGMKRPLWSTDEV